MGKTDLSEISKPMRPPPPQRLLAWPLVGLLAATAPCAGVVQAACAPDSVGVGAACVDRYEASVWRIPAAEKGLVAKVRKGKATFADLVEGGALQVAPVPSIACAGGEYGGGFPPTGSWTERLYAASIAGVLPSTCITWFQAEQACRLSGKRLVTNQEWQAAATGTPDPGAADDGSSTCATATWTGVQTGSRAGCVSTWGAHDLIGNVSEWTGDWGVLAGACGNWTALYGDDTSCSGTSAASHLPSAYHRGGDCRSAAASGAFAFDATSDPTTQRETLGFRCAR